MPCYSVFRYWSSVSVFVLTGYTDAAIDVGKNFALWFFGKPAILVSGPLALRTFPPGSPFGVRRDVAHWFVYHASENIIMRGDGSLLPAPPSSRPPPRGGTIRDSLFQRLVCGRGRGWEWQ